MNKAFLFLTLIIITFSSCRIPYYPDIDTDQQILVVDAFLTNHTGANYVKLTLAIPYDSAGACPSVQNATVYLTDYTHHNKISFEETSAGYYEPVYDEFAGEINSIYALTVITPDGYTYVSEPETILGDMEPDSVYGGYDKVEYLTEDAFGKTIKGSKDVCAMYFDYIGDTTTTRFRYNSSQLVEFFVSVGYSSVYCWRTLKDNSLRFTNEKYASSSNDFYKQEICTAPPSNIITTSNVISGPEGWTSGEGLIEVGEYKRIVEVNQYRLNDDSYAYYKEVKAQYDAEGKIFDPVISQLKGNISCSTVPLKPVFGFFEASNLITMSYDFHRNELGTTFRIVRINNVSPHRLGGISSQRPDFWVQ